MNLTPLIRQLRIQTKDLRIEPLNPNWAQQEFINTAEHQLATTGRIRIIVLKARQLGISTISEALLFTLAFVYEGYKGLIIAHEIPASQNLLNMTHRYWDHYPFQRLYTPNRLSRNDIGWIETGSNIKVATAGNKAVGRSATIHFCHASEVAFWPEPRIAMLGLRQTIPNTPGTGIILESTANGVGDYFHEQWLAAEAGETEYTPLFFPWHKHPDYMASAIGIPYRSLGNLDAEEKALRAMGVSDDRLAWRRWAITNLCESDLKQFMQEYPSTPEEAFISSGTNVFPADRLRAVFDRERGVRGMLIRNGNHVEFKQTSEGPLTLYALPSRDKDWGRYIIGGDPTHTTRGDNACAQVVNRMNLEQVAVWKGKCDPGTFAEELFKLGLFFNEALLCPEIEGPGAMTVGKLLGMNYPHVWRKARPDSTPGKVSTEQYGWSTTVKSKHLAVTWLLKSIVDGSLSIHDAKTYEELLHYVTLDNGSYGNANGEPNDDHVMALAIAICCHFLDAPNMNAVYAGDPRLTITERNLPLGDAPLLEELLDDTDDEGFDF